MRTLKCESRYVLALDERESEPHLPFCGETESNHTRHCPRSDTALGAGAAPRQRARWCVHVKYKLRPFPLTIVKGIYTKTLRLRQTMKSSFATPESSGSCSGRTRRRECSLPTLLAGYRLGVTLNVGLPCKTMITCTDPVCAHPERCRAYRIGDENG